MRMPALALAALASLSTTAMGAPLSHGGWEHVVPIDLPPAPRGTAPELALVADHLAQDTVVGDGWRLTGLSKIVVGVRTCHLPLRSCRVKTLLARPCPLPLRPFLGP